MNYTRTSPLLSLGVLLGLSFTLIDLTNHYILTPQFYENSGEVLSGIPANNALLYASYQKWIYFYETLYTILKTSIVALLLYTVLYLVNKPVLFARIFLVVVYSEFVFLIAALTKVLWFYYRYPHGTLSEWHRVYVLSALSLCATAPAAWYYPLQTLNVFELAYCLLLAHGIARITDLNFRYSFRLVLTSYLPALLMWVAMVTYCTILFFPQHA